jgi:signal transduction histidine kinase
VFRNFVDNALKYGGEGLGHIDISYEEAPLFHIFSVHNDGACLDPEACQKVFDLFTREATSRNVSGSGLGLAIVKEIAELHEGRVWSESETDKGVTFYFAISKKL